MSITRGICLSAAAIYWLNQFGATGAKSAEGPTCQPARRAGYDHPLNRLVRRDHHLGQMFWPELPPLRATGFVFAKNACISMHRSRSRIPP